MNSYTNSNGYLLLFRGTDWHMQLSPEEIQRVMGEWGAWFDRLGQQDKLAAANPLENEGAVVSGKARSAMLNLYDMRSSSSRAASSRRPVRSRATMRYMCQRKCRCLASTSRLSFSSKTRFPWDASDASRADNWL